MKSIWLVILLFFTSILKAQSPTIDSLKIVLDNVNKETEAYVDLLNEIGLQFWIVDSKESKEYGNEALKLADILQYTLGKAKANRVIGVANWTQGNYVLALKYLDHALKEYSISNNPEGIANVILNQAMVYADIDDHEKALTMYDDAVNKFSALNLRNRIATTYTKIGSLYLEENKIEKAKVHLENALAIHSEDEYTYGVAEAHNRLGILYLKKDELEQAFYHLSKSMELGKTLNDKEGLTSNLLHFGRLLLKDRQYQFAEDHIKLSLKNAKENNLRKYELQAYNALKELKIAEGNYKDAIIYSDKFTALKDSIFNSERSMQIAAMEFKNELESKEDEVQLLKEKQESNRLFQWGLSLGFLGILISALIFYLSFKKQAQQRKDLEASKQLLAQKELENSKLRQQELKQQLIYKNKELTSYTLNFVQKNELLAQLQQQLELLKTAAPSDKEKIVNSLNRSLKQHINIDKNWQDFKRVFEEVHSDFIVQLKDKHPDLSANDLKICALTRLNLNIKETANMLGITPESVKTARYRLRKKLNLEHDQELFSYFLEMDQP